ncbi:MAG TPA: hypothetical protein VE172_10255 [Stackebrandtia sp.]|uniref:hypothetical protein n=1 Tax=Stackebrandtia sp. TaxID=2023065 RepID=UPI002D3D6719|nr:hypothetical protein [Stackebrandtia sp.]HZE39180.1 hypothetical protein [Stackebrandtia sp.]
MGKIRNGLSIVLVILAAVVATPAVVLVWADDTVVDRDEYLATVTPLLDEPAVRHQIANALTSAITARLDVDDAVDRVTEGMKPRQAKAMKALAVPLKSSLDEFVADTVNDFVDSDAGRRAWVEINTVAHQALMAILRGDHDGMVSVDNDTINVDLKPVIAQVKKRLRAAGLKQDISIPDDRTTLAVYSSQKLSDARGYYDTFNVLRIVLPIVALVLLAAGVILARNRRLVVIVAGAALVVAMAAVLIGTWYGRSQVDKGTAYYDAFAAPLHTYLYWMAGIGAAMIVIPLVIGLARRRTAQAAST